MSTQDPAAASTPPVTTAMILAAGLGTRLKPWTDHHPKALAVVNGKSLLQRNIEYLQQSGITKVVVNVHHFADQIIAAVEQNAGWGTNIIISDETDAVLETGGGLKKAARFLQDEDDFVLMNVDILTDLQLPQIITAHRRSHALATLAVTGRTTSRYFLFDDDDMLCGWRNVNTGEEKLVRPAVALHQRAFSGVHVISREIFKYLQREGKFSMVDVYLELASEHIIRCFDHSGSKFIDVGKPESVVKAEALFS